MITSYARAWRQFSREARLYLITSALFGFCIFGGIYPTLLNLYLLRLGYGPEFAGVINGTGQLVFALLAIPIGAVGRRFGSRRMLITSLILIAIGFGLFPLLELNGPLLAAWLITTHIIGQLGIATYFVGSGPFLMTVTTPLERSHVYAVNTALWPLAGFAGSLMGGFLPGILAASLNTTLNYPAPYRYTLLVAALLMIPAVIALTKIPEGREDASPDPTTTGPIGAAPIGPIFMLALAITLRVVGEGVVRTFINIYMDTELAMSTAAIGTLLGTGQLLAVPAALVMPLLTSRWGDGPTYLLCTWGMAVALLPLALIPHWAAAGLGYMGLTALIGIARPAIVVFQMEIVLPQWRTLMSGATATAVGLGWGVASLGGGFLIVYLGYTGLFLLGALLAAAGAMVFWVYFRPANSEQKYSHPM